MRFIMLITVFCFGFLEAVSQPSASYRLIVFEGSDWCANCSRLEKNILNTEVFQQFLKAKNISIEKVDFPQRKKQDKATQKRNATIAEQYQFDGVYPTLILQKNGSESFHRLYYSNEKPEAMMQVIEQKIAAQP